MSIGPIPDKLKDLKRNNWKISNFQENLFPEIAIIHGKSEFLQIKGSICYIPVEAANIYNVLQRPSVSNGLIVIQLIRNLN